MGSGGGGAATSFELATASPADAETTCDAIATTAKAISFFIVNFVLLRQWYDGWLRKLVAKKFFVKSPIKRNLNETAGSMVPLWRCNDRKWLK